MFGPSGVSIGHKRPYSEHHVPQIQLSLESPPGPSADNLFVLSRQVDSFDP
jgi:hypothetical protein